MSLVARAIDVTVTLGEGSFGESGSNTVTLSGYRVSATISKDGLPAYNSAQIRVYGMSLSLMNQLSRVGQVPTAVRKNVVSISVGDSETTKSVAFAGIIVDAWADFQAAPEVAFNIAGSTGYFAAIKPVQASSYTGPTDAAVIMESLAKQMNFKFENNGVSVILASPYFWGTARQQALSAAAAAKIFVVFDNENGVMAILPKNGARGSLVPIISADTGMVGYPVYSGPGTIVVKSLYNPTVQFLGKIQIDSIVKPASGVWQVTKLSHSLESQVPNGDWFTDIVGNLLLADRPPT